MAVIGTDTARISNLIKKEFGSEVAYCREVVTAYEASAKVYKVGEVLGKITASGKVCKAVETAVDGSKVFYAICIEDKTVPATTDTKVQVLVVGPAAVSKGALSLDSTYDNDTKKGVIYTAMRAAGIKVLETV